MGGPAVIDDKSAAARYELSGGPDGSRTL